MIKEAIDKILSLAAVYQISIGGRQYTDKSIYPVKEPLPDPLKIHTLTGLVDYIKAAEYLDDLHGTKAFFQVASHNEVKVLDENQGDFLQRPIFMVAQPPENREYPFGRWLDVETFIIELQAKFVPDDNTRTLLAFVSSIKEANDRTSADDGISQTVTAKSGVSLLTEAKVPNPVTLRPYRTFMEITQPEISCVFRLRPGPEMSLHEADGGLWRIQAIQSIREYLEKAMAGTNQKILVIA